MHFTRMTHEWIIDTFLGKSLEILMSYTRPHEINYVFIFWMLHAHTAESVSKNIRSPAWETRKWNSFLLIMQEASEGDYVRRRIE